MTVPVITPEQLKAALQTATQPAAQPAADPAAQQLGDKFKAMMQHPRMEAPHDKNDDMNIVGKLAASQDAELQNNVNDIVSLTNEMPMMSMQEVTAATMKVTLEIANTQLDMQAKMGIVNSSKSAIDTLMKNQ